MVELKRIGRGEGRGEKGGILDNCHSTSVLSFSYDFNECRVGKGKGEEGEEGEDVYGS